MDGECDVVVVGGGSTGCGIARDLARRGVSVVLVERGNLTHGTTGRMHGLLHSGARYADGDPESATQCIEENRVVRSIAGHCVEPTGGLFVCLEDDDPDYLERKRTACEAAGIPVEVLTGAAAREREPALAADTAAALAVPDAAVDPFRLCVANAADAEAHGARILTHTPVVDVERTGDTVTGVTVEGEAGLRTIEADVVVNATGAWTGQLATMAGLGVAVRPSKGAMTIMNVRQVDTVINHCRPRGDADIVVPHETTAILGTTDVDVDDPDDFEEARWEVETLIDDLSRLVPELATARSIRSFWGVRPLYDPGSGDEDPTAVSRDFAVLDHEERDGVTGFVSVVGGKFTTYRLMAERVADLVCARLGVATPCTTAETPLPGHADPDRLASAMERFGLTSPVARRSRQRLGSRAADVLETDGPNPVVCGCEAVTRAEVQDAIERSHAHADLNEVRIRTRASMGNCQGAFCCQALANELFPAADRETVEAAFRELYEERWKGQRHALWGEHLGQAMLGYALHATTWNRDRWPPETPLEWNRYGGADGGH